jgi:hypothetical protein
LIAARVRRDRSARSRLVTPTISNTGGERGPPRLLDRFFAGRSTLVVADFLVGCFAALRFRARAARAFTRFFASLARTSGDRRRPFSERCSGPIKYGCSWCGALLDAPSDAKPKLTISESSGEPKVRVPRIGKQKSPSRLCRHALDWQPAMGVGRHGGQVRPPTVTCGSASPCPEVGRRRRVRRHSGATGNCEPLGVGPNLLPCNPAAARPGPLYR